MKKNYLFLLLVLSAGSASWSQKIWDGPATGGSWATAANWNNNTLPVATDIVTFSSGVTGTITNVPNQNIAGLVVSGNSNITLSAPADRTLTVTDGSGANDISIANGSQLTLGTNVNLTLAAGAGAIAGRLNVNADRTYTTTGITTVNAATGILNNTGTIASAANNLLVFENGATYIHARDGGSAPLATWNNASFCNITGITGIVPGNLNQAFGHFTWNCAGQSTDINLGGALTTVNGDLNIANTSVNGRLTLTSSTNVTLAIGGNLVIGSTGNDANFTGIKDGNAKANINVTGNYTQIASTDVILNDNNNTTDGECFLNITGNFLKSGGLFDFVTGDADAGAGLNGSINLSGNFSHTGGTMETTAQDPDIVNGEIFFVKNGIQTFNASDPGTITFTNFTVSNNSILQLNSNLRLSRDDEANFKGTFIVQSGGALNTSTFNIASQGIGGAAIFTLSPNAKLITSNPTGVQGAINTANLTTSFNSAADYEFRGASTGVFTTTTPNTIRDIIVNNAGGNVTLAQPLIVNRSLKLMAGAIITTTTNLLTIAAGGSTTGAIGGSFVNGPLAKMGTAAFMFPVGKVGAGFRNIGITAPSANSTFMAEFFRATPSSGTLGAGITQISRCEYWTLTRPAGAGSAQVILSWESGSPCTAGGQYVTDPTTLRVAHLVGGTWVNEGRQTSTGNNAKGTVTSANAVSTFSPFTLASSTASANPLPVIFANEKAYEQNNGIQIEWSNMTETDVVDYTVERSANGRDFTSIAQQLPTSNQNNRADYSAFDATPGQGANFYRIRAEEITGKVAYSKVLSVNRDKNKQGLSVYPNPVTGSRVTISLSNIKEGKYDLRILNVSGQDVYKQIIHNQGSSTTQILDLPSSVKPGVYNMIVTSDDYRETRMFVVQ